MTHTRKISLFLKLIIGLYIIMVPLIVLSKNHFLMGTGLIVFRWLLVATGLFILFKLRRIRPIWQLKSYLLLLQVLLVGEYTWHYMNRQKLQPGSGQHELTVMTYNIYFKNTSPQGVLRNITTASPDVLAVQELTPEWTGILNEALAEEYPYREVLPQKGVYGLGVYSKYPLSEHRVWKDNRKNPYVQRITIAVHDKKVRLFNTHLASPSPAVVQRDRFFMLFNMIYRKRAMQINALKHMCWSGEEEYDTQILAGDLNTMVYEPLYLKLEKEWVNLHAESGRGWGLTFPNHAGRRPFLTLDYIFMRGKGEPKALEVIPGGSSDHLAVLGKIVL